MNKLAKLLSVGDLRSAGNSEKVAAMVLKNHLLFGDLMDSINVDDAAGKMRACDAIEKISRENPELLKPFKSTFLKLAQTVSQKEVRWHLAQILPRLELTKIERKKVYQLMMTYLRDESRIVKTFAMQALTDLALQDVSYVAEVRNLISRLIVDGAPSMQSRGKKLMRELEKIMSA